MRKANTILTVFVAVVSAAAVARATILTFDDILPEPALSGSLVPQDYGGFQWANMYYVDNTANSYTSSGLQNSGSPGNNLAFNGFGSTSATYQGQFDLISADFAAVFNDGLQVNVMGSGPGVLYTQLITCSTNGLATVDFNWTGLSFLLFMPYYGGTPVYEPPYPAFASCFAIDNINYTPTPEPTTLVMLAGLGVMLVFAYKRRRLTR